MKLSDRQKEIIKYVKEQAPITGDQIASELNLSKATIRPDLSLLTATEILIAKPKVGYLYNKPYVTPFLITDTAQRPVEEVMKVPVIINQETTIDEAINLIFLEDSGSLYVTEDGELVGIVSRKDLLKAALLGNQSREMSVSLVMSRMPNVITLRHDDTVAQASRKIVMHKVDSLPVLKYDPDLGRDKIVGKVSKTVMNNVLYAMLETEV